jgi:hypothetical protein
MQCYGDESDTTTEALDDFRRKIQTRKKYLDDFEKEFKSLADTEPDEFKRISESTFSKYAEAIKDLYNDIEICAIVDSALKFKIDGLRDIVLELEEVKNNPGIQEKIRKLFQEYESRF